MQTEHGWNSWARNGVGARRQFGRTLPGLTAFAALACLLFATPTASAQAPQFPPGFPRPGQGVARDPAESSAYSAAVGEPNLNVRMSAIQQFLLDYPNSSLRQAAIAQLQMAQRQSRGRDVPAEMPSGVIMNRPAQPPPPAVPTPAPAPAAAQAVYSGPPRDSLLQKSAQPAEVTVAAHSLTIKANNSNLSEILHQISSNTGMKIEGLSKDERIFGSYGPGDAREVLLALLEGSGYNVVMVGADASGTPRELSLTQRGSSAAGAATPVQAVPSADDSEDGDQEVQQIPQPEPPPSAPPQASNDGNQQPRSPQEILQELQRLRQQNQQNQPIPPQ